MAVPFTSGGDVDLSGFRALAKHVLESGVTSSMLFGFASEFYKLADEERVALSDSFLEATRTRGDVTAIVSVTDHATEVAIRRAKESVDAGADALNLLPPYMLAPSRDAVLNHVAAVLEAVEAPVIVQLAPALTGLSLEASTLVALARSHPNLSMVKVESIPPGRVISELAAAEPPIPALVGYAGVQLPDALRRGVAGVQPGSSFPEIYLAITESGLHSEVTRGENAGRKLDHFDVVRELKRIGQVKTKAPTPFAAEPRVKIASAWKRENLRAVVFVQEARSRRVLAAASTFFSEQR